MGEGGNVRFPPAVALQVSAVEKVAGRACGWLCLRKPALSPALSLPLILLEVPWAKVQMHMWILLRAPGSSGRAGAASSAPEACSGETPWVWGSAFKYVQFLSAVLPPPSYWSHLLFYKHHIPRSRTIWVSGSFSRSPARALWAVPAELWSLLFPRG